ncbi:hypothetical protein DH86_00000891 [Scytalidium sp. 3C]|nr:hypothetical protein DH86_00000891 [Scytalidium sp. 3C]
MASMAAPHYHILPQQQLSNDEDTDYILYPPEPNMFQPQPFVFNGNMADFNIDNQESFPATTGFNSTTMYAEAPQFGLNGKQSPILCDLESPELRAPPSNYSTASGASATSSVMGSPHSMYGSVPVGDWTSTNALGITPSIAQYDSFGNSNDFHFPGVDGDFPMDFTAGQTKSFTHPFYTHRLPVAQLRRRPNLTRSPAMPRQFTQHRRHLHISLQQALHPSSLVANPPSFRLNTHSNNTIP